MQIVDSHVHVWINDPNYPWPSTVQDIPACDAHPDDIIDVMKENGVNRAVLVQNIKYLWDNRYTANVMKTYPSLFMGVCRVDPEDPGSPDCLSYWTEEYGFRGVRLSPEPDSRGDWFVGPLMIPLFKRAAELKIPILILTQPSRLSDLANILEQVPNVNVIIDHLADCLNKNAEDLERLIKLARYPGVYLKIGHIPQNSSEAFPWHDTQDLMEKVWQVYGSARIMWGSDWPFCLNHMTYSHSMAYILRELKFLTQEDREWILGKTALQFWPFKEVVIAQNKIEEI